MQDEILVSELSIEQYNSELVMKENDVMESNQEEDAAKMEIQNLTDITEFKSIQGEPDQVCESLEILSLIQSRYIHILSNTCIYVHIRCHSQIVQPGGAT